MKNFDIASLIEDQIPGFVKDSGVSMLPKFLEYYYEFMESEDEQNTFTRDILKYFDSFKTSQEVLDWNFEEVAQLPNKMATDKRKLAKRVYDIYRAKGTEESIKALFRAFYDVEVDITYPSHNILRASDGRWSRESEVLVRLSFGVIDAVSDVKVALGLTSGQVVYKTALRAVKVDSTQDYWLTFEAGQKVVVDIGNRVFGTDEAGTVLFVGEVIASPNKVEVLSSGKGFRVGQVFRVPGTFRDSVFKITSTGPLGTVTSCEMIQFGYGHAPNLTIDISPFKGFPPPSSTVYTSSVISPTVTQHNLSINDGVYQISDRVVGGDFVVDSIINEQTSGLPSGSLGLTINTYLESVATVRIVSGGVASYPGKWTTNDGRLNIPNIVLQDNYYYQPFSYVIHGDVNLSDYENTILPIAHPAGMRNFADMVKTVSLDVSSVYEISRIRRHTLSLDDVVSVVDDGIQSRHIHKYIDEGVYNRYVEAGYWDENYVTGVQSGVAPVYVTDVVWGTTPPYVVSGYWDNNYVNDQLNMN